jgi:hypothetical protein
MALVMATDMSLGMGAWMRLRGHSWRHIVQMGAPMYLPFAVFVPPVWFGALSGGAMISAGHLLMLALMLWRRNEYGHGGHSPSYRPRHPRTRRGHQERHSSPHQPQRVTYTLKVARSAAP